MIIDCIADLHGHYPKLEGGDLLIVAGDLTSNDQPNAWGGFFEWLGGVSAQYSQIIVIGGNHDNALEHGFNLNKFCRNATYLCDSGTEFEYWEDLTPVLDLEAWLNSIYKDRKKKLKIWGSPWTLTFDGINPKCTAFTGDEELLASKFELIPDDIDILITHGPPYGVLDDTIRNKNVGSESLIKPLIKSKAKYHIFGHIHESYGTFKNCINGITYINCSHVNEHYEPVNKPIRIIL